MCYPVDMLENAKLVTNNDESVADSQFTIEMLESVDEAQMML